MTEKIAFCTNMTCIACQGEVYDLQARSIDSGLIPLIDFGHWYCPTCKINFNRHEVKLAELAHWKAVDEVFAGTVPEDFDKTGKLIDYGSCI